VFVVCVCDPCDLERAPDRNHPPTRNLRVNPRYTYHHLESALLQELRTYSQSRRSSAPPTSSGRPPPGRYRWWTCAGCRSAGRGNAASVPPPFEWRFPRAYSHSRRVPAPPRPSHNHSTMPLLLQPYPSPCPRVVGTGRSGGGGCDDVSAPRGPIHGGSIHGECRRLRVHGSTTPPHTCRCAHKWSACAALETAAVVVTYLVGVGCGLGFGRRGVGVGERQYL